MSAGKLDSIDLKILSDLQDHGRMTNVELAQRAGISAPPCLRRVKALEEAAVIKSYHAEVEPKALGYTVVAFAYVGLSNQAEGDLNQFERLMEGWDEVRECYMLSGEVDFLLKIVAQDLESFRSFVTEKLTPAANVNHVKTSLCLRPSFRKPGVPIAD